MLSQPSRNRRGISHYPLSQKRFSISKISVKLTLVTPVIRLAFTRFQGNNLLEIAPYLQTSPILMKKGDPSWEKAIDERSFELLFRPLPANLRPLLVA